MNFFSVLIQAKGGRPCVRPTRRIWPWNWCHQTTKTTQLWAYGIRWCWSTRLLTANVCKSWNDWCLNEINVRNLPAERSVQIKSCAQVLGHRKRPYTRSSGTCRRKNKILNLAACDKCRWPKNDCFPPSSGNCQLSRIVVYNIGNPWSLLRFWCYDEKTTNMELDPIGFLLKIQQ